jgi:hypothetical protein
MIQQDNLCVTLRNPRWRRWVCVFVLCRASCTPGRAAPPGTGGSRGSLIILDPGSWSGVWINTIGFHCSGRPTQDLRSGWDHRSRQMHPANVIALAECLAACEPDCAPTQCLGCIGVDTNRNWGYEWGDEHASDDPCSNAFMGPAPWTEPEVHSIHSAAVPAVPAFVASAIISSANCVTLCSDREHARLHAVAAVG